MRTIATAIAALGLLALAMWAGGDSSGGASDAGVTGASDFAARIGPGGAPPDAPAVSIAVVPAAPRAVWGRPAEFAPPED
jgi:hypothetical protein